MHVFLGRMNISPVPLQGYCPGTWVPSSVSHFLSLSTVRSKGDLPASGPPAPNSSLIGAFFGTRPTHTDSAPPHSRLLSRASNRFFASSPAPRGALTRSSPCSGDSRAHRCTWHRASGCISCSSCPQLGCTPEGRREKWRGGIAPSYSVLSLPGPTREPTGTAHLHRPAVALLPRLHEAVPALGRVQELEGEGMSGTWLGLAHSHFPVLRAGTLRGLLNKQLPPPSCRNWLYSSMLQRENLRGK